ncbi:MAG: hypothetical protein H7831_15000 [Magnetococcus sp. WYHC-3]
MIYLWLGISVWLFAVALRGTHLLVECRKVIDISSESVSVFNNAMLTDDDKERHMRKATGAMLRLLFSITWRSVTVGALAASVPVGGLLLGQWDESTLLAHALDPVFLLASTLLTVVLLRKWR